MTTAIIRIQFPPHIIEHEGRRVNAEVWERDINERRDYARRHKFDLEAECRNRYGYSSEWLTREQYSEISNAVTIHQAERWDREPKHVHRCPTCGDARYQLDKYCRHEPGDLEFECRACEERLTVFYRRVGQ